MRKTVDSVTFIDTPGLLDYCKFKVVHHFTKIVWTKFIVFDSKGRDNEQFSSMIKFIQQLKNLIGLLIVVNGQECRFS